MVLSRATCGSRALGVARGEAGDLVPRGLPGKARDFNWHNTSALVGRAAGDHRRLGRGSSPILWASNCLSGLARGPPARRGARRPHRRRRARERAAKGLVTARHAPTLARPDGRRSIRAAPPSLTPAGTRRCLPPQLGGCDAPPAERPGADARSSPSTTAGQAAAVPRHADVDPPRERSPGGKASRPQPAAPARCAACCDSRTKARVWADRQAIAASCRIGGVVLVYTGFALTYRASSAGSPPAAVPSKRRPARSAAATVHRHPVVRQFPDHHATRQTYRRCPRPLNLRRAAATVGVLRSSAALAGRVSAASVQLPTRYDGVASSTRCRPRGCVTAPRRVRRAIAPVVLARGSAPAVSRFDIPPGRCRRSKAFETVTGYT